MAIVIEASGQYMITIISYLDPESEAANDHEACFSSQGLHVLSNVHVSETDVQEFQAYASVCKHKGSSNDLIAADDSFSTHENHLAVGARRGALTLRRGHSSVV